MTIRLAPQDVGKIALEIAMNLGDTVYVEKSPFPSSKYEDEKIEVFFGWLDDRLNHRYIDISVIDQGVPTVVFSVNYDAGKPIMWGNPVLYKPGRWVDYLRMVHEKSGVGQRGPGGRSASTGESTGGTVVWPH